jgi:hypothetical protein
MSIFEFQLEDHPARQRIRGVMVPIIRDVKAIRVKDEDDGRFYLCGYLNVVTGGVQLLQTFPEVFVEDLEQFVAGELGQSPEVSGVNHLAKEPETDGDSD